MVCSEIIAGIKNIFGTFEALSVTQAYTDEIHIKVSPGLFKDTCLALHKMLSSSVYMLFASDERRARGIFTINCVFGNLKQGQWIIISIDIPQDEAYFDSLAKTIYSASLFEREIWEMFGIQPKGSPDLRRLRLHNEVWPKGNYPLRKDFQKLQAGDLGDYEFDRVEGDGVFEVPVGPVHAGIIGPGHFRFSVAGEPIINLETRLGFTHRGVEKLFEGQSCIEAIRLAECVSGDASFAHSLAFTQAAEKISGIFIPKQAVYLRAIFLELERMYNHVNDIGGMAVDVGFSFPSAYASVIKEALLKLNDLLTASRYLKKVNTVGGVLKSLDENKKQILLDSLKRIENDFNELVKILYSSVSFMDRIDTTGALRRKTAEGLGVVGLIARASGIPADLREYFSTIYKEARFKIATEESGDVLARLKLRIAEFKESIRLIEVFVGKLADDKEINVNPEFKEGRALGYVEGWRGPVLYWMEIDTAGLIQRCKVVDPSFLNWQGLSYAVLGNIIPDFPLCNKSFDLSYSGGDL
ncbi:MAG: NADH-quinone oxidoreductase subunit C [Candidatus Omnitrophica bacterium]|jgi:Ni,Fe-hydrogenase III large subunit/Ni,Fe-hydrogenase III component G|nr:NADH-quinone oxidoreductase subunit C [Candidatus Omnitrophota bacterium]